MQKTAKLLAAGRGGLRVVVDGEDVLEVQRLGGEPRGRPPTIEIRQEGAVRLVLARANELDVRPCYELLASDGRRRLAAVRPGPCTWDLMSARDLIVGHVLPRTSWWGRAANLVPFRSCRRFVVAIEGSVFAELEVRSILGRRTCSLTVEAMSEDDEWWACHADGDTSRIPHEELALAVAILLLI